MGYHRMQVVDRHPLVRRAPHRRSARAVLRAGPGRPDAAAPRHAQVAIPVDLSATPIFRILALATLFTNNFGELYGSRFGVGLPEWRTLAALGLHGPMPAIRIAQLSQIDRGAICRAVASLERRGLLRRSEDSSDARKQLLTLTPRGCKLHDRIAWLVVRRQSWLLAQFSQAEQAQLAVLLTRLERAVAQLSQESDPKLPVRGAPAAVAPRDARGARAGVAADPSLDRQRLLGELERFRRLLLG